MLSKQNSFVDPMNLFSEWLHEAEKKELNDPNAAALSTADESGYPNVRIVLIKKANINGFIFF
jgi:pyridoxamine 5'-phosphate oxidase